MDRSILVAIARVNGHPDPEAWADEVLGAAVPDAPPAPTQAPAADSAAPAA